MPIRRRIASPVLVFGAALLATACSGSLDGPGPTSFSEIASVSPITEFGPAVEGDLEVANISSATQGISWIQHTCVAGNSGVRMRVYREDGGQSVLVWDSSRLPEPCPGAESMLVRTTIAPRDTFRFQSTYLVSDILGDSLAPGQYRITLTSTLLQPVLPKELTAGTVTLDDTPVVPPGTDLNGTWTGTSNGVTISLALTWTADSVYGSGTYSAAADNSLGCGLQSLGAGTLRLEARRQDDFMGGVMFFDVGNVPPYSGRLTSPTQLAASFGSVDTGPCEFDLTRAPGG